MSDGVLGRLRSLLRLPARLAACRDLYAIQGGLSEKDFRAALYAWNRYARARGYFLSLEHGSCVDSARRPVPWYSYPAIEQLDKWDFSACDVFEYGAGSSTQWWAQRARSVVSVEGSPEWHARVSGAGTLPASVRLLLQSIDPDDLATSTRRYAETIATEGPFDVIVIDGESRSQARLQCVRAALPRLRAGGLVILDNSDWHPESSAVLREAGLMQFDYTGLAPLVTHAETTSLFVAPGFCLRPRALLHPGAALGGLERTLG